MSDIITYIARKRGNEMGRRSKKAGGNVTYSKAIVAEMINYFTSATKGGCAEIARNGITSFVKFAKKINTTSRTLRKWATERDDGGEYKHPEFAEAYEECKAMVADMIEDGALIKRFDASFAKYMLEGRYRDKDRNAVEVEEEGMDVDFSTTQLT